MTFYAISALINAVTSLTLGLIVFFKNPKGKANIGFALFALSAACWSIPYYLWQISNTAESALFWSKLLMAGAIFIPITYLYFVFALLKIIDRRKKFLALSYLIFFIFLIFDFTPYFVSHVEPFNNFEFWPIAGPVFHVFLVLWIFYAYYAAYVLLQYYIKSQGIIKLQLKYVTIGTIIGYTGGITNYFLWYKIPIPPIGNITASIYLLLVAYAIIKYRFMDIRIVARKIYIYFGIAIFTYGMFYLIAWIYQNKLGSVFSTTGYLVGLIIAPLFVIVFYSVEHLLKITANKFFFVSLYNYQETINKLTDELNYYIDLDKIVGLIVDTIKQTMQLDRAGVLLVNTETNPTHYQIAKVIGFNRQNGISLVQDSFLTKYLQKNQKPLVRDELSLLSRDTTIQKDKQSFDTLFEHMKHIEASLCLPLMSGKKLIGIIVLGAKISGDAYTQEDLELLNTMAKQAGIAIENAMLYKQVQDFSKNLQQKVDEQTKYLKELLEMKSDFLRVVNHQLNTPLSVMKGYFSMMEEGSYPADKAMPSIKAGLERISSTVADFWDAYELEGERMKIQPQKSDITEIVSRLIPEKQKMQLTQERNLTIEVLEPEFKMPVVWCDYKKIAHVVSNLLDNGIHYTRKGSVTLSYELAGDDFLKINVKDTGVGIFGEDKKKIFKKFSRGDKATDLRPDGSGLGLFIAKKIVEGNGGEMTYYSEGENKGTTFSFTLPVYKDQQIETGKEKSISRKKIVMFKK